MIGLADELPAPCHDHLRNQTMPELYLPVPKWEGLYEVSNYGAIKSIGRYVKHPRSASGLVFKPEKLLTPHLNKTTGYWNINFVQNGFTKNNRIHMLVALAFLPPCPGEIGIHKGQWTVDHIDENKNNNYADNLQWLPCEENSRKGNSGRINNPNGINRKLNQSQLAAG